MKKTYMTPGMMVVHLQHQGIICGSEVVRVFSSTDDIDYGGGGSEEAYTKQSGSIWDNEW